MSMNCDTRQSETVAVALLRRRQTFPPGALFDRLRRALYPDVNVAATQKNGQIAATSRGAAAKLSADHRRDAGADQQPEHEHHRRNREGAEHEHHLCRAKARKEFDVVAANEKRDEVRALLKKDVDPAAQKKASRNGSEEEAGTFAAIARDWLDRHVGKNCAPSTYKETERLIERDVMVT
jgi:hypothetical protein